MSGVFYLSFLALIQCGCTTVNLLPELESTVKVQTGLPTSFGCSSQKSEQYLMWIKFPLNQAPVCIAALRKSADDVTMCALFRNQSRITATWNKKTFNLTFTSVEPIDVATYYCGSYDFRELFFENGTKLILEEHNEVSPITPVKDKEEKDLRTMRVSEILVVVLAVTNVAWIFLKIWLCHSLRKKRAGERVEDNSAADKMDDVNYAALTFENNQRRTVPKTSGKSVIYGAVRHQQES